MKGDKMSRYKILKGIERLEKILDRTTSNYNKARNTLNKIKQLEQELEYK